MDKPKLLSGDELVARGVLKRDISLPELGLKDVVPSGSWLEQKQIQSALEARKHLIEVERIEKCGTLSHAEWREDLMLAEVRKLTGGHWQFLGHNVGKTMYLNPEEALFLMELNCLQLKYNGVTVSLQQAYSLLLRSKITVLHYKVYASLSRLGLRVLRHEGNIPNAVEVQPNNEVIQDSGEETKMEMEPPSDLNGEKQETDKNNEMEVDSVGGSENTDGITTQTEIEAEPGCSNMEVNDTKPVDNASKDIQNEGMEADNASTAIQNEGMEVDNSSKVVQNEGMEDPSETILKETVPEICTNSRKEIHFNETLDPESPIHMIQSLEKKRIKPFNTKHTEKCFEQVPDITESQIVTLAVPKEDYIPRNVFLNNLTYVLNLEAIKSKTKYVRPDSVDPRPYSASEEVNGDHIRRIKGDQGSNNTSYNIPPLFNNRSNFNYRPNFNFRPNFQFRPNNLWRPNNMNFFPFVFFQRNFMNYQTPRFQQYFTRPSVAGMYPNFSQNFRGTNMTGNARKRKHPQQANPKQVHLTAIKNLALRIKQLVQSGYTQTRNIEALQKLIQTFNLSYSMRLRITENYEVVNDENIVETITLDDEESSKKKKPKNQEDYNYAENLKGLKQLALKLKGLESKEEITSRHRRAFSNLLKRFNKSYNADIYLNDNFEIKDRKLISLDSSSDSDCVIEEPPKKTKGKKLKNPFSILKRLQEKRISTSNISTEVPNNTQDNKYSTEYKDKFGKWLPIEESFGRAEVLPKFLMNTYLINDKRQEFLFEFMKSQSNEFDSWRDIKMTFLKNLEEAYRMSHVTPPYIEETENSMQCLIRPDDHMDTPSVLKKLSIIGTLKDSGTESSLAIDFDVYNRDVKNFRKTNLPKPDFRIVCISETSSFPKGKDIAFLHSKIDDNIPVIFAIVGVGSISYLQINPIDIPVYIASNDLT